MEPVKLRRPSGTRADRLAAGLALVREVEKLMEAKFEGDIYKQAFANVAGIQVEQVTAAQRQHVKLLSFGARMGSSMASERQRAKPFWFSFPPQYFPKKEE